MKKGILFGGIGGGVVAIGAAAFIMASGAKPEHNENAMEKLRGTDAYYADKSARLLLTSAAIWSGILGGVGSR